MTTYIVNEITGNLIDAAVAKAEGLRYELDNYMGNEMVHVFNGPSAKRSTPYSPSGWWSQGGPIIDRERIVPFTGDIEDDVPMPDWVAFVGGASIVAYRGAGCFGRKFDGRGPTALIAAMRAFVASKFGATIDLDV